MIKQHPNVDGLKARIEKVMKRGDLAVTTNPSDKDVIITGSTSLLPNFRDEPDVVCKIISTPGYFQGRVLVTPASTHGGYLVPWIVRNLYHELNELGYRRDNPFPPWEVFEQG